MVAYPVSAATTRTQVVTLVAPGRQSVAVAAAAARLQPSPGGVSIRQAAVVAVEVVTTAVVAVEGVTLAVGVAEAAGTTAVVTTAVVILLPSLGVKRVAAAPTAG